jgi:L-alanine-DL-glutamate epimerase-like enolase superfamily enzyme
VGRHVGPLIERLDVQICELPTIRQPETDGTASWSSTTMVIATVRAGGVSGMGYSYVAAAAAGIIRELLEGQVLGRDAFAIPSTFVRMCRAIRNHGRPGVCAMAVSAVDVALWDLKAKLLGVPLAVLLGPARAEVPVYASGGFTSTPLDDLAKEIASYREQGHRRVKIKIGAGHAKDVERVRVAREAAGDMDLMVDANGAYSAKDAIALAEALADYHVIYFEEPVSSDDLEGLALVRDRILPNVAAGEYGHDATYFRKMLPTVDILQADATRCMGITGFLQVDALCTAANKPLSAHCAPALHLHPAAAALRLAHIEYFFDHARMEQRVFDGFPELVRGALAIDPRRPGLGLTLRPREVVCRAA